MRNSNYLTINGKRYATTIFRQGSSVSGSGYPSDFQPSHYCLVKANNEIRENVRVTDKDGVGYTVAEIEAIPNGLFILSLIAGA